jgi:SnoaL-like domain
MEQFGDIADRLMIQDLNQRYAVHVDLHEIDAWVELFTKDASFDEREFGTPQMSGHEEIRAYGQQLAETVHHVLHHMTTHVISDLTTTSARGIAFAVVEALMNDGSHARHQVLYRDRYEKIDGKWLFSERVLKATLPPEVFAGPAQSPAKNS